MGSLATTAPRSSPSTHFAKRPEPVGASMGDVVNLRRARKAKTRSADAKAADANRVQFGRSKAERQQTAAEQTLIERRIDAHKRETPNTSEAACDDV